MSHELETFEDGSVSFCYAGELPWHGLGTRVPADLTPEQMLKAAKLDWTVDTIPAFAEIDGVNVDTGRSALVRSSDNSILDVIPNDWHPNQNIDAFEFFNEFVGAGDMEMHTAGSLKGGTIVWALAKINESFAVCAGKDQVDGYLLFTNPHQYGRSIDIRMTPTRVVCNNTLTLSLNTKSKNFIKMTHRSKFNPEAAKEVLGISSTKLGKYKEMADFLSNKRFKDENVVDYFKRIFPIITKDEDKKDDLSRNAELAMQVMHTQPGAELGEGTFWQLFNTTTYMADHLLGRNADTRLQSSWYGQNANMKQMALKLAVDMAEAA